ncbi:hypothetical protein JNUCC64_28740 [Streptomyces sp. JNUCC 64]
MASLRDWGLALGTKTGRSVARLVKDSGEPDATRVREAAEAADWAGVRAVFEERPGNHDRIELLRAVGDTDRVERWICDVMAAEPEAALPRVVAGIRYISWGWEARTGARARDVSRERFELFHTRLREAERWLYEAAEREPGWTSPWYGLLLTGRGLQVGQTLARRRFEAAVRRDPHHLAAHQQLLQQVCDKWGGSHEAAHSFARKAAAGAPGGSPLGQLVAIAHIEQWLSLEGEDEEQLEYMLGAEVEETLREAADHSYRHPDFVPGGVGDEVLNAFAMAFALAGEREAARECFRATEGRVTEFPWYYLDGSNPVRAYRRQRSAVGH